MKNSLLNFNMNMIRSIILRDDILYLYYTTKAGKPAKLTFPEPDDLDTFFMHFIEGYESETFSAQFLFSFYENVEEPIKAEMITAHTGFGELKDLDFIHSLFARNLEI